MIVMIWLKCVSPGRLCAWLILLGFVTAPVTGFPANKPTSTQQPAASVAATTAETEPSLSEILTEMEELEVAERRWRLLLVDDKRFRVLAAQIDEIEKDSAGIRRTAGDVLKDLAGLHVLVDIGADLRAAEQRLTDASAELADKATALEVGLDRVNATRAKTDMWIQTAQKRNAPPAVLERLEALAPRHEALARELLARRDQVLEVLGRATQLHGVVNVLRVDLSDRRDQIADALRTERAEPIWRVEPNPGEWGRVMQFFDTQIAQSFHHAREHAALLLLIAVVAFVFTYWLIVATRAPLEAQAATDPYARHAVNLFRLPAVAASVAALVAVIGFGPHGPFNYYLMLCALVTLPATVLARAVVGPQVTLSLYTLAGAVISLELLWSLVAPLPLVSRLLLIAQCGGLAAALGTDLGRGRFDQSFPRRSVTLVRLFAAGIIILLVVAVLAAVTGHLGAARVLRNLVLGALGIALLIAVMAGQLYGLTLALMHTGVGHRLRIVRLHPHALRSLLRTGLVVAALLGWVSGMLFMLGLGEDASRLVDGVFHAEITIGSTSIDLTGVWVGLAVILGTVVLVKIVGPVLELEILPRLTHKPGLPFVVSAVTRYLLLTAGTVLAMAAMGIDLTKVTLLAGALGVGIGFGLQSVVNNFVSGLILLLERPVNVGDVVQMGQLRGVIRRIGVRSSTVQTGRGAEVIVPNADLISKEVTNWTRSDRRRHLEIDVGVAYGTDPEQVVRLLEEVGRGGAEVLANPPPSASFTGFGDSSLTFRLEAWVDDYARGGANESALRMAIVRKFREANIEIPFPQRDLHIRRAPAAPVSK